jgi:predicted ATP-binding protein involved in virulence
MRLEKLILRDIGPFREVAFEFFKTKLPKLAEVHLFVGPNGSGKSTLLYSIASCLGAGFPKAGQENVSRRMASDKSCIKAEFDDIKVTIAKNGNLPTDRQGEFIESGPHLDRIFNKEPPWIVQHTGTQIFGGSNSIRSFTQSFLPAFAYSGARTIGHPEIKNILGMPKNTNLLENSLDFDHQNLSQPFAQWLATSFVKEAFALKEGKQEAAHNFTQSVERVSSALNRLIKKSLRIHMTYDPLDILLDDGHRAVPIDLLPDGIKSILSWLGDLLMRLDGIEWPQPAPTTQQSFILLLDEIDIHLHPEWQWRVLPFVQELFPNSQIFVSTHSPFVVSSANGAWIHPLRINNDNGDATPVDPIESQSGTSFLSVIRDIFGVEQEFDGESQTLLANFYQTRDEVLKGQKTKDELESLAKKIAGRGEELKHIVMAELAQVARASGAAK